MTISWHILEYLGVACACVGECAARVQADVGEVERGGRGGRGDAVREEVESARAHAALAVVVGRCDVTSTSTLSVDETSSAVCYSGASRAA